MHAKQSQEHTKTKQTCAKAPRKSQRSLEQTAQHWRGGAVIGKRLTKGGRHPPVHSPDSQKLAAEKVDSLPVDRRTSALHSSSFNPPFSSPNLLRFDFQPHKLTTQPQSIVCVWGGGLYIHT